jgi:predicted dehydrogenase
VLRLAVVGAGMMGSNHARVAAGVRDCQVVWVVDPDRRRGGTLAEAVGARWTATVDDVLDDVDAAVVAVPTKSHVSVGCRLLNAKVACLVEKPMALDADGADELIAAADRAGVVLAVGHVERHNPAVIELDRLLGEALHVTAERISVYQPRVADDVVLDLMIHDLDIVASLAGEAPCRVHATARQVHGTAHDLAAALLEFPNGMTASLTASRLGQQKIRQLSITQLDSFVNVDLVVPTITVSRVHHAEFVDRNGSRYRQTGMMEIPYLEHRGEPLALELQDFVEAVTTGGSPRVTGADGRRAVAMANQVIDVLAGGASNRLVA